eukprot:9363686-Lingulodinium_polyedra.AAC.1
MLAPVSLVVGLSNTPSPANRPTGACRPAIDDHAVTTGVDNPVGNDRKNGVGAGDGHAANVASNGDAVGIGLNAAPGCVGPRRQPPKPQRAM